MWQQIDNKRTEIKNCWGVRERERESGGEEGNGGVIRADVEVKNNIHQGYIYLHTGFETLV